MMDFASFARSALFGLRGDDDAVDVEAIESGLCFKLVEMVLE